MKIRQPGQPTREYCDLCGDEIKSHIPHTPEQCRRRREDTPAGDDDVTLILVAAVVFLFMVISTGI